jgi:putative DNA primase/helicase
LNSYTEFSPSGEGVRIFVRGSLPSGIAGKKRGNIEAYSSGRYLTVTGHRLNDAPPTIESRQAEIGRLCKKFFSEPIKAMPANGNGTCAWHPSDDELLAKLMMSY